MRFIGWYPIGVGCFLVGALMYFFPRTLPRAALRRRNVPQEAVVVSFKGDELLFAISQNQ